jgi:hypothetical protein
MDRVLLIWLLAVCPGHGEATQTDVEATFPWGETWPFCGQVGLIGTKHAVSGNFPLVINKSNICVINSV